MFLLKRELSILVASTALAVACVVAWGSPFLAATETTAVQNRTAQIPSGQLVTLTGVVVCEGNQYLLRDDSDKEYRLDDAVRARTMTGKMVRVTGQFEEKVNLLHIDSIVASA